MRPGGAAIGGLVQTVGGVNPRGRVIHDVEIGPGHGQSGTEVVLGLGEGLSAIGGAVNTANIAPGRGRSTEKIACQSASDHDIAIRRYRQPGNGTPIELVGADDRPAGAGIGALEDADAVVAAVAFAGAGIEHIGIARINRHCADGQRGLRVGQRGPTGASIAAQPDAAGRGTQQQSIGIGGVDRQRAHAAAHLTPGGFDARIESNRADQRPRTGAAGLVTTTELGDLFGLRQCTLTGPGRNLIQRVGALPVEPVCAFGRTAGGFASGLAGGGRCAGGRGFRRRQQLVDHRICRKWRGLHPATAGRTGGRDHRPVPRWAGGCCRQRQGCNQAEGEGDQPPAAIADSGLIRPGENPRLRAGPQGHGRCPLILCVTRLVQG